MHLMSTKEVLIRWVLTFKREKPFVTGFLPSCQFCGRYGILSCYTGWPNEIETNLRMKYFTN